MLLFTRWHYYAFLLLTGLLLTSQAATAQKLRESKFEKGLLNNGQKTGVWEYYGYTPSGEKVVLQRYDYGKQKLLYFRPGADMSCRAEVSPGKWSYVHPDQPPLFIGGDATLAQYTTQLVYPTAAIGRNIQGKVVIGFLIDTLGHTSNHHLVQRIGGGCDEEALRVAQLVPNQWVPARIGHRAVPVEYELPLNFRLAQP